MRYLLVLLALFPLYNSTACISNSNKALKRLEKGHMFLKSYWLDGRFSDREEIVYTIVLSPKTYYQVALAEKMFFDKPQLKVSLLNRNKKLLATNDHNGELAIRVNFQVKELGIYYLKFEFTKEIRACGVAVLGCYRFKLKANRHYQLLAEITHKHKQDEHPILLLFFGYTDQHNRMNVTMCYQDTEWVELLHDPHLTDRSLATLLSTAFEKRFPNLRMYLKDINPKS